MVYTSTEFERLFTYFIARYINLVIASIHSLASVLSIQMFNSALHVAEILPNISASNFLFVAAFPWFAFSQFSPCASPSVQ
jgi:hypothetical protein